MYTGVRLAVPLLRSANQPTKSFESIMNGRARICVADFILLALPPPSCPRTPQVRLQELCQDLLGPEHWDPSMVGHAWSPRVLGLEKRTLLEHIVIPTMAKERLAMTTQVE